MIKSLIYILFVLATFQTFAQTKEDSTEYVVYSLIGELTDEQLNNSGPSKLTFVNSRNEATRLANDDISNGTPFLLLAGGIAPVIIATDPKFERKYGIYFYEYGCTGPEQKYIIAYNEEIFKHLTEQYYKSWLKEMRKDVVGFKEWKKND